MLRAKSPLLVGILCAVLVTGMLPAFSEGPAVIAVIFSRDIAPYRQALEGFEQQLKREKRPYKIVDFNIEAYGHDPESIVDRIESKQPALILTLGSAATDFLANRIKDTPIVFSLVLPSSGRGSLESQRALHPNMTGATMEIPLAIQFEKIHEVLPGARKVGVLYDPKISGPVVDSAAPIAARAGLQLVPMAVSSEGDVVQKLNELEDEIDVLWSVADSTVFTPQGLKHILLSTLRNRIPFVGLSPAFVKAGALLALSCDYEDIGRQSGEMAARILDGESPERIPTAVPRDLSYSLNLNTARQINVAIADEVRDAASTVF